MDIFMTIMGGLILGTGLGMLGLFSTDFKHPKKMALCWVLIIIGSIIWGNLIRLLGYCQDIKKFFIFHIDKP